MPPLAVCPAFCRCLDPGLAGGRARGGRGRAAHRACGAERLAARRWLAAGRAGGSAAGAARPACVAAAAAGAGAGRAGRPGGAGGRAPWVPFGPALAAQGLPPERLLCVQADAPAARLWAAGRRCAVPRWRPCWPGCRRLAPLQLRRLHLAAQQRQRLLVVFRTLAAQHESSPARLRLLLEGTDALQVRILKRRGPPVVAPVPLPAQPPRLAALLAARRRSRAGPGVALPPVQPAVDRSERHALDRTAAA